MFYHKDVIKGYHEIFYKICYKRNFKISHKLINNDSEIENIEFNDWYSDHVKNVFNQLKENISIKM
jgi:hypothetical protein